ncbi:MAG: hypothetical protein ACR5K5_05880, partial [Wolbachia sp.]
TARKHIPRTDNFIILNMETKGAKPFPKSPIYCFLNHSAERIRHSSVKHWNDIIGVIRYCPYYFTATWN